MTRDPLVGTLFAGRFQIESLLGRGGMGAVYLARHTFLQRQFAIKVIRSGLTADPSAVARFRREARVASQIEHPHITTVYDYGHTEDGMPYLAMEYVRGENLAVVLGSEGPLPVLRTLRILSQIAEALAAAHACSVVHRDLKPGNVLLTTHGEEQDYVKILDFGLAKIVGLDVGVTMNVTAQGHTSGSPEYMSPEQCLGEELDRRSDLYSLGILTFQLLVGRVPFTGSNVAERVEGHLKRVPPVPSMASGRSDFPPGLDDLILRCLAKKREERYPDATAFGAEVTALRLRLGDHALVRRTTARTTVPPEVLRPLAALPGAPAGQAGAGGETKAPISESVAALRRARALEEIVCALRDQGLGTPEMSEVLARKLLAEDRAAELETAIEIAEREMEEHCQLARQREARLRQALIQLEHEVSRLPAVGKPSGPIKKTLSYGLVSPTLRRSLEDHVRDVTSAIQVLSQQLEQSIAGAQRKQERRRESLAPLREEVTRLDAKLRELVRRARGQLPGDSQIVRLCALAEV